MGMMEFDQTIPAMSREMFSLYFMLLILIMILIMILILLGESPPQGKIMSKIMIRSMIFRSCVPDCRTEAGSSCSAGRATPG